MAEQSRAIKWQRRTIKGRGREDYLRKDQKITLNITDNSSYTKKTLGKSGEEQTLSRQSRKQQRKEMVFCIFHPI